MKKEEKTSDVKVTVGGHEVVITERSAMALEDLPRDDFSVVREWIAFVDTVAMHLSLTGDYSPSEAGAKYAMQVVVDMKLFLLSLTNEDYYEHFL